LTILSVAVEAVTVAGTFRDYYKFARLEKAVRSVKKNREEWRTIVGVHSRRWFFQGNTPHLAAVQNSGSRKARAIKETHLPL
jgi:hypothetical protein